MSGWEMCISSLMNSSTAIKRAAVIGTDGTIIASTDGSNAFRANDKELKKFIRLFDDIANVPMTGADLENVHFIVPWVEENLIFGKRDRNGFFASKTKTVILIAVYEGEKEVSADVRAAVEKMAEYLTNIGF